jgi:hypothetical protein
MINSETQQKINEMEKIIEWSKTHPKFNTDFVESVLEKTKKYESITDKQSECINKIIKSFKISV